MLCFPSDAVFFSTYCGYNRGRAAGSAYAKETTPVSLKRKGQDDQASLPSPKHGVAAATFFNLDAVQINESVAGAPSSAAAPISPVGEQVSSVAIPSSPSRSNNSVTATNNHNTTEFVEADRRCTSIKEAIKFARSNNLLGVICEATPLIQVPSLITHIKESGLILTSFGAANRDPQLVHIQKNHGVDALMIMDGPIDHDHQRDRPLGSSGTSSKLEHSLAISEIEEGVIKYQGGVDSGPVGI